ncbi:MAG: hypothetical protein ACRBCS_06350 [Cellvibrionaceae bacterium]
MHRPSHCTPILFTTVLLGAMLALQVTTYTGPNTSDKFENTTVSRGKEENNSLCSTNPKNENRIQINLLNNSFIWIRCKSGSI